jgi:hypothetical protein
MAKETELEVIERERRDLEGIAAKLKSLEDAHTAAETAVSAQQDVVVRLTTPEVLLNTTDEQIEQETKRLRTLQRDAARAKATAQEYGTGPAKELTGRLRALERRRWDVKHAAARAVFVGAVRQFLQRANELLAAENALGPLAAAAGFSPPEPLLRAREAGRASTLAIWSRDLCRYDPDLLAANDPQRRVWESSKYVQIPAA